MADGRSRAHAVHPDPLAGVLDRGDLGELDHRGLGRAVRGRWDQAVRPDTEAVSTIEPDCCARITGTAALDAVDGAEDVDAEGPLPVLGRQVVDASVGESTPALLISTSSRPKRSTARATTASTWVMSLTSASTVSAGAVPLGQAGDRRLERRPADVAEHEVGVGLAGEVGGEGAAEGAARSGDGDDPPGHTSRYPPSTLRTAPVTNAEASEARNW